MFLYIFAGHVSFREIKLTNFISIFHKILSVTLSRCTIGVQYFIKKFHFRELVSRR